MKKYKVVIEETITEEFEVEAQSETEALETARLKYHTGQFVVSPGEVQSKQIKILHSDSQTDEWFEL